MSRVWFQVYPVNGRFASALVLAVMAAWPVAAPAGEKETALRRAVAWQAALDLAGYSPGLIDGQPGPRTRLATREFQKAHGLPATGELDEATAKALKVRPDEIFIRYTIEPQDLEEIGPCPASWVAKSKLQRLGHEALENVLAEKFHCSLALLATLNPRRSINSLKPGDQVVGLDLRGAAPPPKVAHLEVNLTEKIIRVIDKDQRVAAMFHCSVAANKQKLPSRNTEVVAKTIDPWYHFDPAKWPEVKERVGRELEIPPGPRNPVGRCWISLGLPGYGMHGTPNPELIGKTGSHGCFRLTNWDALRLSRMVEVGTPVKFADHPDAQLRLVTNTRLASRKR